MTAHKQVQGTDQQAAHMITQTQMKKKTQQHHETWEEKKQDKTQVIDRPLSRQPSSRATNN